MNKKAKKLWCLFFMGTLFLLITGVAVAATGWVVNVTHDLNGGSWPAGQWIDPYQLSAPFGQSMAADSLSKEQKIQPQKPGAIFKGWSVLFTDLNGNIVYDGRDIIWDLNDPFDYYPSDPQTMNCLMIANWEQSEAGEYWTVNVNHQLGYGVWPEGKEIEPYQISAPVGQSMAADSLFLEQVITPYKPDGTFKGWGVLFTDEKGDIIYDSRNVIWDLKHPFDYYPENPRYMECLMVAIWDQKSYEDTLWSVNVSHLLRGGRWPEGKRIEPYRLVSPINQSMTPGSLGQEQQQQPIKDGAIFKGWSVLFYDSKSSDIIYDGRGSLWDLNHPFDYYPDNPREMTCLMIANWEAVSTGQNNDLWTVYVSHDLNGGVWPTGQTITPYTLTALAGQSMATDSLNKEKNIKPLKLSAVFKGWSVLFTDAANGNIIYDGRSSIWDLNHPFDYYPNNPRKMNCLMIANWEGGLPAIAPELLDTWTVNVSHDLNSGTWPDGQSISPYTLTAPAGQSMAPDSLNKEKNIKPQSMLASFTGWSVLFTDANNGNIIYDGRGSIWDLNHPFDFYPNNPREMNCLMIANWEGKLQVFLPEVILTDTWTVHVSHDLNGGVWPDGQSISPYTIWAFAEQSMPADSLNKEKNIKPQKTGSVFTGWSVLFTDTSNGNIVYDGRGNIWDLNHPFDFYAKDPREMNCLMIANWK